MLELKKLFIENGTLKASFGLVMVFFSWGFDGEYKALQAVSLLILIDFLSGTYWSLKTGQWESNKSKRGVFKVGCFLTYMLVARMVDKVVPFAFFSPMMDSYIVITEAGSILENFGKLGYPVPTFILTKLKSYNEKNG